MGEFRSERINPVVHRFSDLHAAARAMNGVRTLRRLPRDAVVESIVWQGEPDLAESSDASGRSVISYNYEVSPSLERGVLVAKYLLNSGVLLFIQESSAGATSVFLGVSQDVTLPDGRHAKLFQSGGMLHVVINEVDHSTIRLASTSLSEPELLDIAFDTVIVQTSSGQ